MPSTCKRMQKWMSEQRIITQRNTKAASGGTAMAKCCALFRCSTLPMETLTNLGKALGLEGKERQEWVCAERL